MKISARNQFKGTICDIQPGAVSAIVKIDLGGQVITADITKAACEELELAVGKPAVAIIKASNIMVAAEAMKGISARNQLAGKIVEVTEGAVNGHVKIAVGDVVVTASVTNAAIRELGLAEGACAVAIVKSTDVLVGVE